MSRGLGAMKGWASRRQHERQKKAKLIDALKTARRMMRFSLSKQEKERISPAGIAYQHRLDAALAKIDLALWTLGVHK